MKQPELVFDEKFAAVYDEKVDLWTASREALFSLMRLILADLPPDARFLGVGAGTGTELIALAQTFPGWHFTAVEPAPAMLDICRHKVEQSGLASRFTFHQGFLDALPASKPFDGATCLLVSHFFAQSQERSQFFAQIASRLRPQGILISSDLVLGMAPGVFQNLREPWLRMVKSPHWNPGDVAALTPPEVEAIIAAGGFETPTLFFQTLLIHAWFSRRAN